MKAIKKKKARKELNGRAIDFTVAHELRNLLAVINMTIYNIKRKNKNCLLDKHVVNIEKKISEIEKIIKQIIKQQNAD